MPPWGIVGPSSTRMTRRRRTASGRSSVTGEAASTMVACGAIAAMSARSTSTSARGAPSTLLTTTMSAMRAKASPG